MRFSRFLRGMEVRAFHAFHSPINACATEKLPYRLLAKLLGAKFTVMHVTGAYHLAFESEGFSMPDMKSCASVSKRKRRRARVLILFLPVFR